MTIIIDEKYEKVLLDLKQNIRYKNKDRDVVSILLFRNYLTELFHLKRLLGNDSEFIKSNDAHNIFLELKPSWLNELKDINSFYEDLKRFDIQFSTGRFLDGLFIYLFVYWEVYKDSTEIKSLNVENIYLSPLKILERINHTHTHNAQFQIGGFTFKNTEKYKGFKLPSIDDKFLDYIESKCVEIPNQEETNQLWEEFKKYRKLES